MNGEPGIPAPERPRQKDPGKFQDSLLYLASPRQ